MSVFLLMQLDLLRIAVNKPIHVTSGYRCPKHNKKVGGAKKSQHMTCKAADIWVENFTTTELATIAKKVGFDFILIEPSWIHVDMRNHLIS